jgi:tetratricopeptide (TPR) repeat protein
VHIRYANCYYNTGEYDKALEDLSKSMDVDSEDHEAYLARSIIYYKKGRYLEAIDDATLYLLFYKNDENG